MNGDLLPEHYPVDISAINFLDRLDADGDNETEIIEVTICWSCETDWPCEAALAEVPD